MRAKLDENLPVEAAELLRTAGWKCDTVDEEGLAGADDSTVAARCRAEARVLSLSTSTSRTSGHTRQASTSALSWCARLNPVGDKRWSW
jgi:hypothetical protein